VTNAPNESAAWYPDPVGRHDYRFWSGTDWTDHVSDQGVQGEDPIDPIKVVPVTIRPSAAVFWVLTRSVPMWRWGVSLGLLAVGVLIMYLYGGWFMVVALGGFGLLCVLILPLLYFNVFYIRADAEGIEVRNQIGHRRLIPRDRITAVTVGKTWGGSFTAVNFAFIVSPRGEPLGRFYLQNWDPKDFTRLANALGLHLYGRPGRTLDRFHSAKAVEHVARFYAGSVAAGLILGCSLPFLLILGFAVYVFLTRATSH
jgi:hypothetical protein